MPKSKIEKKRLSKLITPIVFRWALFIIGLTCRKKWIGLEHIENLNNDKQNWIYSIWHDNITYVSLLLRGQNLVSLISTSSDGAIAANILGSLGFQVVRGSSSKGGIKAIISMIKELKSGKCGAITPDGPRGPRYCLQNGVILIGQKAGIPLVPFHVEATRQWVLNSWDRHKFPKPFSTIYICLGEPFTVPTELDKNQIVTIGQRFEKSMLQNVQTTQQFVAEAKNNNEI